jgi:hypothetical protein
MPITTEASARRGRDGRWPMALGHRLMLDGLARLAKAMAFDRLRSLPDLERKV